MPPYVPTRWNVVPTFLVNNCYNYALDRLDVAFRNPGDLSGQPPLVSPNHVDGWELALRAASDGLIPVASPICAHRNCWPVALVVAPISATFPGDYHWYRNDSNGLWSHKRGGSLVMNTDWVGNLIRDPRACARGPYTVFVGFFCVCPAPGRAP
jgi:hypothetical protein